MVLADIAGCAPASVSQIRFISVYEVFSYQLEQLAGAPWAPDPPRGRGVSSDVARLE